MKLPLRRRISNLAFKLVPQLTYRWPRMVTVEASNRCTLKCPTCATVHGMRRAQGYMSFGTFERLSDSLVWRVERLNWSFAGEPLMNPEILGMVRFARDKRGFRSKIDTNGMFLQDHMDRLVESGLEVMNIALGGMTPRTAARFRVNSDYDTIVANIREVGERKRRARSTRPIVCIQFIVMKHNEDQMEEALAFARSAGADYIEFKSMNVCGGFWMTDQQKQRIANHFLPSNPRFLRYRREGNRWVFDERLNEVCSDVKEGVVVLWNGDVTLCCMDYDGKYVAGNVVERPLAEIWRDAGFNQVRRRGLLRGLLECGTCGYASGVSERIRLGDPTWPGTSGGTASARHP